MQEMPLIGRVKSIELDLGSYPFKVRMKKDKITLKEFSFNKLDEAKSACNQMYAELLKYRMEVRDEED